MRESKASRNRFSLAYFNRTVVILPKKTPLCIVQVQLNQFILKLVEVVTYKPVLVQKGLPLPQPPDNIAISNVAKLCCASQQCFQLSVYN